MKRFDLVLTACCFMLCESAVNAQFVKGNDAVKVLGGAKQVETPAARGSLSKPCAASANCHASTWRMVETNAGLVECTEPWARPGTCRASTYGSQKLSRVWVVKRGSDWLECQFPDLGSKCVPMFARPPANLPFDAVQ